jgi:predicted outer membrane protein
MKMQKMLGIAFVIFFVAVPSMVFAQANVSPPRTGSPVIPGGAAIPGSQAVPIPDPADPTPDAVPGLDLVDPEDRERRAAIASARAPGSAVQSSSGSSASLQALIVSRLQMTSLASVELNEFAAKRATQSDVREFAESLVSDQQHFWRALQRVNELDPGPTANLRASGGSDDVPSNDTFGRPSLTEAERGNPTQLGRTLPIERQIGQSPIGQTLPDQFPLSRRPPAQSLTPAADGDIRYGGTLPPAGGETRVPEGEVPDDFLPRPVDRDAMPVSPTDATVQSGLEQDAVAMNQMNTIADRAAQSQLAITKELLERSDGENFDQRFISMQLAELTRLLSELRAVGEIGTESFNEVIRTAEELTEGHLASAEAIATRLNAR